MHAVASSYLDTLARLVQLFGQPGASVDQVREHLYLLVARAQERALDLTLATGTEVGALGYLVDGEPVIGIDPAHLAPLARRLRAHEVYQLAIARHAPAAELTRLVRWIVRPSTGGLPGTGAVAGRQALLVNPFWHVEMVFDGESLVAPARAAGEGSVAQNVVRRYLDALRNAPDAAAVERAAVAIDALVDGYAEAGEAAAVSAALVGLADVEATAAQWGGPRRDAALHGIAVVRTRYAAFRVTCLVAGQLPAAAPTERAALRDAIGTLGEAGQRALVAHLMASDELASRRTYFDALVALRGGVPLLIEALRHRQWYIARNAACLLGEMRACEADVALAATLAHPDDRVRQAVAAALTNLDTPVAQQALAGRLQDPHPSVRFAAVQSLCAANPAEDEGDRFSSGGWAPGRDDTAGGVASAAAVAGPLIQALDQETSVEVRIGILDALGRVGTPDAVRKLRQAVLPQRDRASSFRVAALDALVHAQGRYAQPVVDAMRHDPDPDVQRAAERLTALLPLRNPLR